MNAVEGTRYRRVKEATGSLLDRVSSLLAEAVELTHDRSLPECKLRRQEVSPCSIDLT
jgi:hypothetical protein